MSLLVAANDGSQIWMLSDTAIIGGVIGLRDRTYYPKIEPSQDRRALIGFAGDKHLGSCIVREAAAQLAGDAGLSVLRGGHLDSEQSVDFLYGFLDSSGPRLKRVIRGEIDEIPAAHIGNTAAFEHFQKLRHDTRIDLVPLTFQNFMCGLKGAHIPPPGLEVAILTMLRLFAERHERDVGGWPLAYILTPDGPLLCSYGYSTSDPIADRMAPGSPLPHGTAELGGYGLSVTEFGNLDGVVVYHLQRPGGTVYVRTTNGYEEKYFAGRPSNFVASASIALGAKIDIWFGDQQFGIPRSISVLHDEAGDPCMTVADDGRSLLTSILNVSTPFRSKAATLRLDPEREMQPNDVITDRVRARLTEDKDAVVLVINDDQDTAITLEAAELETLIQRLGRLRSSLRDEVSSEPKTESGVGYVVVIDPAWRTERRRLPPLDGILLKLRDPGLGWLRFLLPHHEAAALGSWLFEHADKPADPPATSDPKA